MVKTEQKTTYGDSALHPGGTRPTFTPQRGKHYTTLPGRLPAYYPEDANEILAGDLYSMALQDLEDSEGLHSRQRRTV